MSKDKVKVEALFKDVSGNKISLLSSSIDNNKTIVIEGLSKPFFDTVTFPLLDKDKAKLLAGILLRWAEKHE